MGYWSEDLPELVDGHHLGYLPREAGAPDVLDEMCAEAH
jgi:hypothetical protein